MNQFIKKYFVPIPVWFISLSFLGCSVTNPINDFFGIQMNLPEENRFKILSYNEFDGVKYQSTDKMDPAVNAWAEISVDEIRLKIVNSSPRSIPLNYDFDQFIIITDENEYILEKGNRFNYFLNKSIEPNSDIELRLKLPNDYKNDANERFQYADGGELTKHILQDFSKLGNSKNVQKDNIKYILIKLGTRTIVLKKVPDA